MKFIFFHCIYVFQNYSILTPNNVFNFVITKLHDSFLHTTIARG